MRTFDYHLATSPADAVATMAQHPDAAYLAGGTNLVDHMKLGVAEPDMLVNVSRLEADGDRHDRRRRPHRGERAQQ